MELVGTQEVELVRNERVIRWVAATLVMLAMLVAGAAEAGSPAAKEAAADMKWGYKTARRGYWQEALARFVHANELTPAQPRILNNIAVAQEANGMYEEALLTYQEGLAIAPNNDALRRNYMRFKEFYSSYIAPPEESVEQGGGGEEADDAQDDS